jgi:hypothetical protein
MLVAWLISSGQVATSPEAEEGGDDGGLSRWLDPPDAADEAGSRYVWAPSGLFPAPYPPQVTPPPSPQQQGPWCGAGAWRWVGRMGGSRARDGGVGAGCAWAGGGVLPAAGARHGQGAPGPAPPRRAPVPRHVQVDGAPKPPPSCPLPLLSRGHAARSHDAERGARGACCCEWACLHPSGLGREAPSWAGGRACIRWHCWR